MRARALEDDSTRHNSLVVYLRRRRTRRCENKITASLPDSPGHESCTVHIMLIMCPGLQLLNGPVGNRCVGVTLSLFLRQPAARAHHVGALDVDPCTTNKCYDRFAECLPSGPGTLNCSACQTGFVHASLVGSAELICVRDGAADGGGHGKGGGR